MANKSGFPLFWLGVSGWVLSMATALGASPFGNGPMMCTLDVKNKRSFKNETLIAQGAFTETTQENHAQLIEVNCKVSGWRPVRYEVQCFFLAADNFSKNIVVYDFATTCRTSNVPELIQFQSNLLMASVTQKRFTPWVINEYDAAGNLIGARTGMDVNSKRQKMLSPRGAVVRVKVDGTVIKSASNSTQPLPEKALDEWLRAQKR